eukprot:ANDGO_05257.mRNA.1 Hydin
MQTSSFSFSQGRDRPRVVDVFLSREGASTVVPVDEPLFAPIPSSILVDQYDPLETYEVPLKFRNKDKIARKLRVLPSTVSWLKIVPKDPSKASQKIAAGMEITYTLQLTFPQRRIFKTMIECVTEREKFTVSIEAAGPRSRLDFPKSITFDSAPVLLDSSRPIFVRNLGDGPAHFSIDCKGSFSVFPSEGYIEPDGGFQLDVKFHPTVVAQHNQAMNVRCDDGSETTVDLTGNAVSLPITVSTQAVNVDPTFVGLQSRKTVRITNPSTYRVPFAWKKFSTAAEEEQHALRSDILSIEQNSLAEFPAVGAANPFVRDLFDDDLFSIVPDHGELWPGTSFDVEVQFHPKSAASYTRFAFLCVGGRPGRIPLQLSGLGVGPKANFTYDSLDVGELFISKPYKFDFILENPGNIDARFQLVPNRSLYGSKFRFCPDSGVVAGGESQTIGVTFNSDVLGEFSESFDWKIEGRADPLVIHVDGVCVGPSFDFDCNSIDFGEVSLSFLVSKRITLSNTSDVSMKVSFRIPSDLLQIKREFDILPPSLTLEPHTCGDVQLDFIPCQKKSYDISLVMDIDGVGKEVHVLPILAKCVVPPISLSRDVIHVPECFINHTYSYVVSIMNESHLSAKYEMSVPRMDPEKPLLNLVVPQLSGIVPAHGCYDANIQFIPRILGDVQVPIYFSVPGAEESAKSVMIRMNVRGPIIESSSSSIDFGKVAVLQEHSKPVSLVNRSPVDAQFSCAVKNSGSPFRVDVTRGVVPAHGTFILHAFVVPDESMAFRDELVIDFEFSDSLHVRLAAVGHGSCLVTNLPENKINFGPQFTNKSLCHTFVLENRGRKAQNVSFAPEKTKSDSSARLFRMEPEFLTVPPGQFVNVGVVGLSKKSGAVEEIIPIKVEADRRWRPVSEVRVVSNFVVPVLQFSSPSAQFSYFHKCEHRESVLSAVVTAKNVTVLPVRCFIEAPVPFSVSPSSFDVGVGESFSVEIRCDPLYRRDLASHDIESRLVVTFQGHPSKEFISLFASLTFPNLQFDKREIRFGCVLQDTDRKIPVLITNSGNIDARFSWTIEVPDGSPPLPSGALDILPIRGYLKPGMSESVDFVFSGTDAAGVSATALCSVDDGPVYDFPLSGEASVISFRLEKNTLDFGEVVFNRTEEKDIMIFNTGKVAFPYSFDLSLCSRVGVIDLSALSGRISPGEKTRVNCRFTAGLPLGLEETILLRVAHLDPVPIIVKGSGTCCRVSLSAPRITTPEFAECVSAIQETIPTRFGRDIPRTATGAPMSGSAMFMMPSRNFEVESEAELRIVTQKLSALLHEFEAKCVQKYGVHSAQEMTENAQILHEISLAQIGIISAVNMARYTVDFGHVFRGGSASVGFRLWNSGNSAVSLSYDRKLFANSGFLLEPEKVAKLPPNEYQDFTVSLNSKVLLTGMNKLSIPFRIRSGLSVMIDLAVNVVEPRMEFSTDKIDFGSVLGGRCKTVVVRFSNSQPLPLHWSLKRIEPPFGSVFDVVPVKGEVAPLGHVDIEFRFMPTEERAYVVKVPVSVYGNDPSANATTSIICRGSGCPPRVHLSTELLPFGSVLPYASSVRSFTMSNPLDVPLEVFSRNFDDQHLVEDDALRAMLFAEPSAYQLLPERAPGQSLDENLVRQFTNQSSDPLTKSDGSSAPDFTVYAIHGPRLSGKTVLSSRIASCTSLPVATMDEILDAALATPSDFQEELKSLLSSADRESTSQFSPELLSSCLSSFISANSFSSGMIIDGIFTKYQISCVSLIQGIVGFSVKENAKLNVLSIDGVNVRKGVLRVLEQNLARAEAQLKSQTVQFVSDDAYDVMSTDQKTAYDLAVSTMKNLKMQIKRLRSEKEAFEVRLHSEADEVWSEPPPRPASPVVDPAAAKKAAKGKKEESVVAPPPPPPKVVHPAEKYGADFVTFSQFDEQYREFCQYLESPESQQVLASHVHVNGAAPLDDALSETMSALKLSDEMSKDASDPVPSPTMSMVCRPEHLRTQSPQASCFSIQNQSGIHYEASNVFSPLLDGKRSRRWIIDAKNSVTIEVAFSPKTPSAFSCVLSFMIVGWNAEFGVSCSGSCDYPRINDEPRNMFYKVVKPKSLEDPKALQAYNLVDNTFDFGPLLTNRKLDGLTSADASLFQSRLRVSNKQSSAQICKVAMLSQQTSSFQVSWNSAELQAEETKELVVSAQPKQIGRCEDVLFLTIENNPEPTSVRFCCTGSSPEVDLSCSELDFGRLLKGTPDRKEFVISNRSLLPSKWKLVVNDVVSSCVSFSPMQGSIPPSGAASVSVSFLGKEPRLISGKVEIYVYDQYADVASSKEVSKKEILVKAETYDVDVECEIPKEGIFDFGVVKVGQEYEQKMSLSNKNTKYEVEFKFSFSKRSLQNVVRIEPLTGILKAGGKEKVPIRVIFKADNEQTFTNMRDIHCEYSDPGTKEHVGKFTLAVSSRAVFSKFTISPPFGLNFGPILFDSSKVRKLDIRNDGHFSFDFAVSENPTFDFSAQVPAVSNVKDSKKASAPAGGQSLSIGPFSVAPALGSLAPGATEAISVTFASREPGAFSRQVYLHVRDRDPNAFPQGLPYMLEAESCIPGINTTDLVSIFEEQQVVHGAESLNELKSVFVSQLRVFSFGTFLVGEDASERFKIANPQKVPVDVNIEIIPSSDVSKDTFFCDSTYLTIPSHESRYVAVSFKPSKLGAFSATFKAVPKGNGSASDLKFEMRGDATLPHISIEKPEPKSGTGYVLDFGRVVASKTMKQSIRVRNHGSVVAHVQALLSGSGYELAGGSSFQLSPSESRSLDVVFASSTEGSFEGALKLQVSKNTFEDNVIKLKAVCYLQNLVIENLPDDRSDAVSLGECPVGCPKKIDFLVRNLSADVVRFEACVLKAEGVKMTPSIGHLLGRSSKSVVLTWSPNASVSLAALQASLKVSFKRIRIVVNPHGSQEDGEDDEDVNDWDDRKVSVSWDRDSSGKTVKFVQPIPEPKFENIDTSSQDVLLPMEGTADVVSCDVDLSDIVFRSTFLFSSRMHKLRIRNTSKIPFSGTTSVTFSDPDTDLSTFSVSPAQFSVDPDQSLELAVSYKPQDMLPHTADVSISIVGLDRASEGCRSVHLVGVPECPIVHFETQFSTDYISTKRLPGLPGPDGVVGPLNPETRVLEIESRGVKVRNVRRFYVLNPTNLSYDFVLVPGVANARAPGVRCLTQYGTIHSGKKFELVFEFIPDSLSVSEAFWSFEIKSHSIAIPLMVVGRAAEPDVLFEKGHVLFRPLLVGRRATEIVQLVNREHLPFAFSFENLDSTSDSNQIVRVSPLSGTVPAEGQTPVELTFAPDVEQSYNINLRCVVKKKPTPLNLNVKGDAYMVKDSLYVIDVDGTTVEVFGGVSNVNSIDFGRIYVGQSVEKRLRIVNSGRYPFDYNFSSSSSKHLSFSPTMGTVPKGETSLVTVAFAPTAEVRLDRFKSVCKVTNGRTYLFELSGWAARPQLRFSFYYFDFGPSFIYHPGATPSSTNLVVYNDDSTDVSFDVLFENSAHLEVKASPTVLKPGQSQVIQISFYPREAKKYRDVVPIEVNGLAASTINLTIEGEGTVPRLELVNAAHQSVSFGSVRVGDSSSRSVGITNKSKIAASIAIDEQALRELGITVQPSQFVCRPSQSVYLNVVFAPQLRVRPFKNLAVPLTMNGQTLPLFSMSGTAQGFEVKLDPSIVSFGPVVERSSSIQKIMIENSGDIGVAFKVARLSPGTDFSLSPVDGFVAPHADGTVEVVFCPSSLSGTHPEERSAKFAVYVEGLSEPLPISCSGTCVVKPPASETIRFSTAVRTPVSKKVTIKNPSKTEWNLRPIIDNDAWKVNVPVVNVAAGQQMQIDVVYHPLSMTSAGALHKGSMFIPCPDGSALLFSFEGEANAPVAEASAAQAVTVPSKSQYVHSLTVKNWLRAPQRFRVVMDLNKHAATSVKCLDYIDVPAGLSRDFKLTIYAFVESTTSGKITFINDETREYCFFNISIQHSPPKPISEIRLETHVRQPSAYALRVDNPLAEDVPLTLSCSSASVFVEGPLVAKSMQETALSLIFMPLLAGNEKDVTLMLKSDKLGAFPYTMHLTAHPAPLEKSYHFEVPLGSTLSQTVRFASFSKNAIDFNVDLQPSDFEAAKTVKAAASPSGKDGIEVSLPVSFTPRSLGPSKAVLRVSHPQGGEYVFTLSGACIAPRPQGPFDVKSGQSVNIPFTNVFKDNAVFNLTIDNPAFIVKPTETVPAGKAAAFAVQYKPSGTATAPVVGKLVVSNDKCPPWVFYVRGLPA